MLPSYSDDSRLGGTSCENSYFRVEDETELAQANTLGSDGDSGIMPLTWRGDPAETHSDWTVMVVTNELQTVSYHVHKSVLCFGTRHSRYFSRVLMQSDSKKMTKVELDARDAANFPFLLDYAYAPCSYTSIGTVPTSMSTLTSPSLLVTNSKMSEDEASYLALGEDINSENAVSIRFLARKFEIDSLTLAVNRFIQRDLNFETGPRYLAVAQTYDDARLLDSATRLCVENFVSLDKKSLLKLPLDAFRNLIFSLQGYQHEEETERSNFLSEVVCRYMEKHPQHVTADLMLELTDPLFMPCVTADAAMGFTALIKKLTPEDATGHWRDLARFSRRCAQSVVRDYGWNDFSIDGAVDEYLTNCLQTQNLTSRIDSLLFATSFAAALDQAQADYELIANEQETTRNMIRTLDGTLNVMEKMNDRKERYLSHQMKALDEAQKKIVLLERELADVKRQRHNQTPPPPQPPTQKVQQYQSPSKRPTTKFQSPSNRSSPFNSDINVPRSTPTRHHTKSLIDDATSQTTSDSVSSLLRDDPAIRDLISPHSIGTDVHRNKIHKMKELRNNKSDFRTTFGASVKRVQM